MSGILFNEQESFDHYGTYMHPFYKESILHFKVDYYKDMLQDACLMNDQTRVHKYTVLLKKAQEQLHSISEPATVQCQK